jgi:threonine dehydratase
MAFTPEDAAREIRAAESRIRPHVRETYLELSPHYSNLGGAAVFFKLENLQYTGSFKARGALNKVLSLDREALDRGVVAASTGNHGAAVAFAAARAGTRAIVFVPENASPDKLETIERLGAEVRFHGDDCMLAEVFARRFAGDHGMTYVSPYNDPLIVGGQGTVAVELDRQLDWIDAVFVSLGGGGLISGIAAHLKTVRPDVTVVGCSPENSQVMIQSVRAGKILDLPSRPTLSDGTAGGVERGAITFDLCRELVDDFVTVTEEEIADHWREFTTTHHMMIEGAAAVAIASFMKLRDRFAGHNVVVVLCGANISPDTVKGLLS